MRSKALFLLIIIMAGAAALHAQDQIYKQDGEVINGKIKMVGTKTITYTRADNPTGPEYSLPKADVEKIVYQNGSQDVFEEVRRGARRHVKHGPPREGHVAAGADTDAGKKEIDYGSSVVSIAPLQFTENGLGSSLSYERALDKASILAFYCPVIATYNLNNGTYYNNATGTYQNGHQDGMYYAMPGVKLYPTGAYGKVRYSIGPSLVVGVGEKSAAGYDIFGNTVYQTKTHEVLGMIINNSLNINATGHVYIGFDLGIGFTYFNQVDGLNQNTNTLVQGAFKIGYRF